MSSTRRATRSRRWPARRSTRAAGRFGGSIAFNGTGSRLSIPASPRWQIGSEDFSIDFWCRIDAYSTTGIQPGGILFIGDLEWSGAFNWGAWWYGDQLTFSILGSSNVSAPWTPVLGAWNHFTFARRGGWTMMWVNGVLLGSGQQTSALSTTGPVTLGADKHGTGGFLNGRLDEVRVLSGRTPAISEPPSGDAFALDADTLVLMHMDGPAGSTTLTDEAGNLPVALNGAQLGGTPRVGSGTALLDGVDDHVSIPVNSAFAFGLGDFTGEAWLNFDDLPAAEVHLFGPHQMGVWTDWMVAYKNSTQELMVLFNGAVRLLVPFTPAPGEWVHVAVSRKDSRLMLFVNGELRGATISSIALGITYPITLGASNNVTHPFKGRMDEFRLSRVARYTSDFTPPARPYRLGE
jgi:hypothetical protein